MARCSPPIFIGYAVLRSFVEYFRGDYPGPLSWRCGHSPRRLVSIGIVIGGLLLMFLLPRPQARHA